MILKRSNPLNHDQFCRFFIRPAYPTYLFVLLISSLSRSLDLSNRLRWIASLPEETRRSDFRVFQCDWQFHDRQFVCREGADKRERNLEDGFALAPSCRRTSLPSILYVLQRLNETMRWIGSPTRICPFPSLIASISFLSFLFVEWRTGATVARAKQFVPEDKEFFRLFQTYAHPRGGFRIERLTSRFDFFLTGECNSDNKVTN